MIHCRVHRPVKLLLLESVFRVFLRIVFNVFRLLSLLFPPWLKPIVSETSYLKQSIILDYFSRDPYAQNQERIDMLEIIYYAEVAGKEDEVEHFTRIGVTDVL